MKNKHKRFLSLLMAVIMVIGMMPVSTMAATVSENSITLTVGESYTFEDVAGDLTGDNLPVVDDTSVATIQAEVTKDAKGTIMGGTQQGTEKALAEAAHTFDAAEGENTYYVYVPNYTFATSGNTANCYLNANSGGHTETRSTSRFTSTGNEDGSVYIYTSNGNTTADRYVYVNRTNMNWDKVGNTSSFEQHCVFYIYEAVAEDAESSAELPGYQKVTDLSTIEDGGEYLLAFYNASNELFVVDVTYMTNAAYGQMLKVEITSTTDITVTGESEGETTVTLGAVEYTVKVESSETPETSESETEASEPETSGAEKVDLQLAVTARYMTNRLTWNAESGVTYTVERSEDNATWEAIGTASTGSYLDVQAGLGTQFYYRVTTDASYTDGVQGAKTGMAALKQIAVLFYEGNDEVTFVGTNKVAIAEGAKATELNALHSGTILYKAYFEGVSGKQAVLGTDNGLFVGSDGTKFRHELGAGFSGGPSTSNMTAGADNTAGFVYDDSNGHWGLSSNGCAVTAVDLDETKFGMLTAANATTYFAGGSRDQSFSGTINYILVLSEVLTDAELKAITTANLDHDQENTLPLGANIGMMVEYAGEDNRSNSWMFDGGSTTSGSFTEIGSIRNYVYQFEEYVRGKRMEAISTGWNSRQRYTINVGKAGQTLADSLAAFDDRAADLDPRAAVYLVGAEDYSAGEAGIAAFKTNLRAYIAKAVKLRSGMGFVMIQTPYPNASTENDELYAEAVREVMNDLVGNTRACAVLVDHNSAAFSDECYNADGSLSGKGHYEMGKQLASAIYGNITNYQTLPSLTPVEAPASYSDVAPAVSSTNNDLMIAGLEDTAWIVEIALESYTLTVNSFGPILVFENLPANEDYVLTITAADMSVRMPVMAGTINGGNGSVYVPQRNANQQAIADLVAGEEPLTWLFMGDSITHGASYTFGHDSISQLFEKFLKDDLGREGDIVINTAVSSADTNDTISEIHARLDRYQPDVVSIMIGTNDSATHINVGETNYKANLRTIIAAIKEKGAKVIFRTPVPTKDGSRTNIGDYADWMCDVAAEYTDVILVEQYDAMSEVFTAAPHMKAALFNSGDYLHPTTEGQTWMLHRFLEATGLMVDGYLTNLWYDNATGEVSQVIPPVTFENGTATMDTDALATAYGQDLYLVKLMATDNSGRVYSAEGMGGDVLTLSNLPADVTFTAEAKLANSAVWVSFGVPSSIEVEVYEERTQTVVVEGDVIPSYDSMKDIIQVEYESSIMGKSGIDNTFAEGYIPLADCEYTFDKQEDGTWLISAVVDGTTVYVDPHAGAGNSGYPNRGYESYITLVDSTDGNVKLFEENGGYLHFWDNDDSKLYWDQCTGDGGHTGHNLGIYRKAGENETASTEVPGYVKVNGSAAITDGGQYLIVAYAQSGGCYALRPCKTASNKYQHVSKVYGPVTELTIKGIAQGNGILYAGNTVIHVQVLATERVDITLNYNYEGAPANGSMTAVAGDPIGELPVPMREGYTFEGWYLDDAKVTSSYVVTGPVTLNAGWVTVPTKEKPANGTTTNGQPFPETYPDGSPYRYRIPGIVTLADGTVVVMADARWTTSADCGGLDTIISASKDNGKNWEYTYANYLGDNGDVFNKWSTTFIDPAIATDGETVYMIADLFPAGVSTWAAGYASQGGSGGFNADGKLMLRDLVGDTYKYGDDATKSAYINMATTRSYDFYLDPNADGTYTIRKESDDSAVAGYTVDAFLNIRSTDGTVDTHLFMADSPYQVYPTNYLYLTTSTDGLEWSAPELIVAKNASESAFLIGPGTGTYDPVHDNMVFTAYSYSGSAASQKTCLLWAGEDGVWHRSEPATTDVWSSEAAAVVLEDGTVRVFYRSGSTVLCYTDYLWVNGEYVRDVNNTSVSTDAVKNSGNGCMLSAVKYTQKVNGKEVILIATPATANSRSDGYIYAFYVNEDGSLELASSHDITPGASEYYAYSCLTVLTQGREAGNLGLFWENAAAGIRYDVIDMVDVLPAVKEVVQKNVILQVGESESFSDEEGYYVDADTDALDTDVASVQITGTVLESALTAAEAVTAIESGEQYVIINTRAAKTLTNATTTAAANAGAGSGLSMSGNANSIADTAIWTIEGADGVYTVKDADGNYLSVTANGASVGATASNVNIVRNGNNWTIAQNGAYLNDFGGGGTCAAGWQNASAAGDSGSQWTIHKIEETVVDGTSTITFTGVAAGTTAVQIGFVNYNITVEDSSEPDETTPEVTDPSEPEVTDPTEPEVTDPTVPEVTDPTVPEVTDPTVPEVTDPTVPEVTDPSEPEETKPSVPECEKDENCVLAQFNDVIIGDWYHDGIHFCVEEGIMNGMGEGKFAPNEATTRAQLVTMLYRLAGEPSVEGLEEPFTDVTADDWFYAPIVWAYENKVVNGVSDTEFAPNANVTREQVATILHRYLGAPEGTGKLEEFPDVAKVSEYAVAPLTWAVGEGLITGVAQPDGTTVLDPAGNATRAQIATILMRHLTK